MHNSIIYGRNIAIRGIAIQPTIILCFSERDPRTTRNKNKNKNQLPKTSKNEWKNHFFKKNNNNNKIVT